LQDEEWDTLANVFNLKAKEADRRACSERYIPLPVQGSFWNEPATYNVFFCCCVNGYSSPQ
jgi:hypothetical protein